MAGRWAMDESDMLRLEIYYVRAENHPNISWDYTFFRAVNNVVHNCPRVSRRTQISSQERGKGRTKIKDKTWCTCTISSLPTSLAMCKAVVMLTLVPDIISAEICSMLPFHVLGAGEGDQRVKVLIGVITLRFTTNECNGVSVGRGATTTARRKDRDDTHQETKDWLFIGPRSIDSFYYNIYSSQVSPSTQLQTELSPNVAILIHLGESICQETTALAIIVFTALPSGQSAMATIKLWERVPRSPGKCPEVVENSVSNKSDLW